MKKEFNKEVVLDKVYDVSNNVAVISAGATVIGHVAKCKPLQVVGAAVTFVSLIAEKIAGEMAFNQMIDEAVEEDYLEKMLGEDGDDDLFEENYDDYEDGADDVHEAAEQVSEDADDEEHLLTKMTEEEIANAKPIDPDSVK